MSATLSFTIGEGGHAAILVCTNLDGSPAPDVAVSYASDAPSVCTVDPSTGVLVGVAAGTAGITGTGTRGTFTHSDTGQVTVVASAAGDFNVVLNLS